MRLFGTNEWAVRIPLALAGISGVVAAYFLALSIAGKRVAFWTVLILQTSALYFGMSRVVTPDMNVFLPKGKKINPLIGSAGERIDFLSFRKKDVHALVEVQAWLVR